MSDFQVSVTACGCLVNISMSEKKVKLSREPLSGLFCQPSLHVLLCFLYHLLHVWSGAGALTVTSKVPFIVYQNSLGICHTFMS